MIIVKEMSSGKRLDEACNHNNDAYDDEVLYTEWARMPRLQMTSAANVAQTSHDAALARLFHCVSDERH
ncbi:MAG: hypothetical protein QM739_06360 [Propionivibrio sp.]